MALKEDLTGRQFGRWTVLGFHSIKKGEGSRWLCLCSCGTQRDVKRYSLVSGTSLSCGCIGAEITQARLREQEDEMIGQRFGCLVVQRVSNIRNPNRRDRHWDCLCDCGNVTSVPTGSLSNGHTSSCGCKSITSNLKHGECQVTKPGVTTRASTEYLSWRSMKDRCTNENHEAYARYGGRGITVCDRWLVFENFLEDMGRKPESFYSLDRKDNSKGYNLENCRWADKRTQSNNRDDCTYLTHEGQSLTITEWSRVIGITSNTIHERIRKRKDPLKEICPDWIEPIKGVDLFKASS